MLKGTARLKGCSLICDWGKAVDVGVQRKSCGRIFSTENQHLRRGKWGVGAFKMCMTEMRCCWLQLRRWPVSGRNTEQPLNLRIPTSAINGELEENNFKVEIGGVWGDGVTVEDCPISVQRKSCLWGLASTLDCSLVRVGLPQLHLVTYPVVKFTDYSCIHPGWMAGWMDEGMDGLKILLNQMEVVTFFGSKHSLCIYYMKSWW